MRSELQTIKCNIVGIEKGTYTVFVVYDLINHDYKTITLYPNWQGYIPDQYEIGFLEFENVKSGDEYWDVNDKTMKVYNYSALVFHRFIKETNLTSKGEIIL
jgi:hypothetical protein